MNKNNILHNNYITYRPIKQLRLPLELEFNVSADDPVRLVDTFVEEMDLSDLYSTYSRIRKNQATPAQLLKIVIYAAMNNIHSSRSIEIACKRDINFMFLLEGVPAPDHATIARFISVHLGASPRKIMAEMDKILYHLGEISARDIFIDGTKIESVANKYTFVWKHAVTKNLAKLTEKVLNHVKECEAAYGLQIVHNNQVSLHTLKRMRKKLYKIKLEAGISFVHGIGKRKTDLQKSIELTEQYISKLQEYVSKLHKCGSRNIVADAGYESEENDRFIELNNQVAYIKPNNYEISKTRKYKKDIGRRENMSYNAKNDCYTCHNGRVLTKQYVQSGKTKAGYNREITVYSGDCTGCQFKSACIKGNNCKMPMEERNKVLNVSKYMERQRKECLARLTSPLGTKLRMNRSIQVEGSFANIKADMGLRRYSYRGKTNVLTESIIVALAYNILRLDHRVKGRRTGLHLYELNKAA